MGWYRLVWVWGFGSLGSFPVSVLALGDSLEQADGLGEQSFENMATALAD